ncbi:MAG: glycosyltransferase family 2 protein [Acidimicrobiia bacterium]|nr:glycosyltransferase family 2 protein [Acidimicrobiia bacterium]
MTMLSIVVPCYNEAQRVGSTLDEIGEYIRGRNDVEVIVVDDGSEDDTAAVARSSTCPNLRVIASDVNRGKGHAVRTGMLAAAGDLRLFTDADGSTPIGECDRLTAALDEMAQPGVAFASIGVAGANVEQAQAGIRPLAGRIGNWLIRLLAIPGIHDSQRGFKLFTSDAAEAIFSRCVVDRWAFDVEVLALARQLEFDLAEIPVTWAHKDDSRVTPLSYLSTLADVVRVRWRLFRGSYRD